MVTPGAVAHGLLAHFSTFITGHQSHCLLLEPSFQQSPFFLNTTKSKHFLTSFTHLLVCRNQGLLGDSHGPYKWGGGGRDSYLDIGCTIFPGFLFFILLILQFVYFLKTPILQGNISALFTVHIFLLDTFPIKSCCPLLNCPVITHLGNFTQYLPHGICHMDFCTSIF